MKLVSLHSLSKECSLSHTLDWFVCPFSELLRPRFAWRHRDVECPRRNDGLNVCERKGFPHMQSSEILELALELFGGEKWQFKVIPDPGTGLIG